jgi:hypothetical protein
MVVDGREVERRVEVRSPFIVAEGGGLKGASTGGAMCHGGGWVSEPR